MSEIPLRVSARTRLVFRPEIVRKDDEPEHCLRGRFVYQRKRGADEWEDYPRRPIGRLDLGEEYSLELSSDELHHLLTELGPVYRDALAGGVPSLPVQLLRVRQVTAQGIRAWLERILAPYVGRGDSTPVTVEAGKLRAVLRALEG